MQAGGNVWLCRLAAHNTPGRIRVQCSWFEFISQGMRVSLLRLEYVVLVDPPTSKEAVAHHLLAKQKNEADQDGH